MRLSIVLILAGLLLPHQLFALPEIKPTFPRLASYFLHWAISDEEAKELSKFDLLILDAEIQNRSRPQLELIRKLNPNAILLAYITPSEIRRDAGSLQEISPLRFKLGAVLPAEWYLTDAGSSRLSFWPGTWILNITNEAPPVQGKRWNEFLPEFVAREILSTGLWDGVFYDNGWDDIVHFARGVPDLNYDGLLDEQESARQSWQAGLRTLYSNTALLAPDKLVFENDGVIYADAVHGVLIENFPKHGFARYLQDLRKIKEQAKTPAVPVLNATTFNSGKRDDFRAMRFGLTTALLSEAYYSFDFGDQDHGQTWWYDEYEVFLGPPLNPPLSKGGKGGVWRRDFEKGIVLVNPESEMRKVTLPIEIEKIRGGQDPTTNNGTITRELTVGANDGVVVLRPLQVIEGAPFENGIFARVFSAAGESTRAGFFAFDNRERSGVLIARVDLDGDEKVEKMKMGEREKLEIAFGDGSFRSLDLRSGAPSALAFGDVTGDGVHEIVVGAAGQVRVFRVDGTLLRIPFSPFGARYKGPLSIAVGDLNNDGFSEIVVGAGPGGGPQIRIFSGEGRLLSGGFFAYDPRFRGGVRVAVGDLDGDGGAEIVTGPGVGGGPQVRIFSAKGGSPPKADAPREHASGGDGSTPGFAVLGSFFAFDRASRSGAIPLITDIDGDGRNEILAVTKEVL